jgi:hypothetical protein
MRFLFTRFVVELSFPSLCQDDNCVHITCPCGVVWCYCCALEEKACNRPPGTAFMGHQVFLIVPPLPPYLLLLRLQYFFFFFFIFFSSFFSSSSFFFLFLFIHFLVCCFRRSTGRRTESGVLSISMNWRRLMRLLFPTTMPSCWPHSIGSLSSMGSRRSCSSMETARSAGFWRLSPRLCRALSFRRLKHSSSIPSSATGCNRRDDDGFTCIK